MIVEETMKIFKGIWANKEKCKGILIHLFRPSKITMSFKGKQLKYASVYRKTR